MRDIKIKEPVFRDKPLTEQDLKDREVLYNLGPEEYAKYIENRKKKDKLRQCNHKGPVVRFVSKKHSFGRVLLKFVCAVIVLILCMEFVQSEFFQDIMKQILYLT